MAAPPPLTGDDLLAAVTDAMVQLHERYHHRAPVTAKTLLLDEDLLACVLGGVSLFGGTGQIVNVVLGAFFLAVLTNGMTMMRVGSFAQIIADGILLIFAIWAEQLRIRTARQLRRQ